MSDCEYFAREFKKKGYRVEYRSDVKDGWDILILDTLGELASVYSIASLAIVGGTFSDRGGQNIMEPAFAKVPVIYGLDVRNFRMESEILSGNGGIMVDGVEGLSGTIRYLLDNPDLRNELGSKAFSSSGKVEFDRITFLKEIDRWI
jgi:3-deoxy-D-manno-octulosonic-acid transferase